MNKETLEEGLLQHIKFCLKHNNEAQAIRLLEKYTFEKQEQDRNEIQDLKNRLDIVRESSGKVLKIVEDLEEQCSKMYNEKELNLWLTHRDVYLYNYYTTYIKSGIPLQTVEDFIKDSHEYLMDRKQNKKK